MSGPLGASPEQAARTDEDTSDEEYAESMGCHPDDGERSFEAEAALTFSPCGYSSRDGPANVAHELNRVSLLEKHRQLLMARTSGISRSSSSGGSGLDDCQVSGAGCRPDYEDIYEGDEEQGQNVTGALGDDEGSDSGGSLDGNPLAIRNLDSGADMQLFKVYIIHDSVSGAEWMVDGYVDSGTGWTAVWQEKRVKDAKTGRITSLAELENELVERVFAQFHSHRVKDLDSGAEIDLFQDIKREAIIDSVRKERIVMDSDTDAMLSLDELHKLLVPASLLPPTEKKARRRRLKLKGKNVKRIAAKISTGFQASMAGLQAGRQDRGNAAATTDPIQTPEPSGLPSAAMLGDSHEVKVQAVRKQYKELSNLSAVQVLDAHVGKIWAMKFSHGGEYLASAGEDTVVRVWEVVKTQPRSTGNSDRRQSGDTSHDPSDQRMQDGQETAAQQETRSNMGPRAPREIVRDKPYRQFHGHSSTVLDLSWSASGFLLSSSMDKTVRLWHINVDGECLRQFQHTDFVTVVDFHPQQDKLFISGSIDGKVRLWNLTSVRVIDFADCHEAVTAAAFSPDGEQVAVGTRIGKCRFYAYEGMKMGYAAQLDVCNKSVNRKITGIQFQPGHPKKVLISSNDSRMRLYDTIEYQQICKYKGHQNRAAQIRATFSPDGKNLVSGSDQGIVYVWSTVNPLGHLASTNSQTGFRNDKNKSFECFPSHEDMVTVALIAPSTTHDRKVQPCQKGTVPPFPVPSVPPAPPSRSTGISCFVPGPGSVLEDCSTDEDGAANKGVLSHRAGDSGVEFGFSMDNEVIVTAGPDGDIKFFQNNGMPKSL